MRSSNILGAGASFVTVAGQASYPLGTGAGTVGIAVDSFGKWDRETFRCYTTTVGTNDEQFLDDIPFDVWRDAYMLGAMRRCRPARSRSLSARINRSTSDRHRTGSTR
jgi:hypothetical protein